MSKSTRNLRKRNKEQKQIFDFYSSESSSNSSSFIEENTPPDLNDEQTSSSATQSAILSQSSSSSISFESSSETPPKKKKKKHSHTSLLNKLDDVNQFDPPPTPIINKIIASGKDENDEDVFLVKMKNLSYHNCRWAKREEFEENIHLNNRFKKFLAKEDQEHCHSLHSKRGFSKRFLINPIFLQVDRIFHHRINVEEHEFHAEKVPDFLTDLIKAKNGKKNDEKNGEKNDQIITSIAIPAATDSEELRIEYKRKSKNPLLSRVLREYLETSELLPSKRYLIYVEYLVKWRSTSLEESTWEIPSQIINIKESSSGDFEITRCSHKKGVESYLDRGVLKSSLNVAAVRYEEIGDLKGKLKRVGLKVPPKTWRDPNSLRKIRPAKLPGGVEFSDWEPPEYKNGNRLKSPYQDEGVRWMIYNWHMKRNCILADEMGLGKTIQTIGFVDYLFREQKLRGPFIIGVPKSTLHNWQREFEKWTNYNVLTLDGNKQEREITMDYEFYFDDETRPNKTIPFITKFDVLLVSYNLMVSQTELWEIEYGLMIIDEAHRLKNPEATFYQVVQNEFTFRHCVLLTGTPLQNNIGELWSLLSVLEPTIFHSQEEFVERYEPKGEDAAQRISDLHKLVLKPFMLRRVKADVEKSLQQPKEIIIWLKLTREQKKYFRAIFEKNTDFLHAHGKKDSPTLNNICMQLRHCCNHPFVLRGVEERTLKERMIESNQTDDIMRLLVEVSCKMDFLDKFLPMMKEQGHKVLIFSQFVLILDILDDYLDWKGHPYERIDGEIGLDARQNAIDRFNSEPDNFVFLLSTRAGGLGINLTSADTIIIYDSDWNPQMDLQAQARAHRIGQRKAVTVYRLITKGSYEEVMLERAGKKLGLERALLQSWIKSGRDIEKGKSGNLNKEELERLIKFGAYHILRDKEDEDSKPQKIEDILAASEVLTPQVSAGNVDRSETAFSQATFKNTLDDNLALNDPDFWRKIGLERSKPKANQYGKRRRTRQRPKSNSETWKPESNSEELTTSSTDSEKNFGSDDGCHWSRTERKGFEKALLRFGYNRWEEIKSATETSKSESECRSLALGFISLYAHQQGRTAVAFVNHLRSDLLQEVDRQIFGGDSEDSESQNSTASARQNKAKSEVLDDLAITRGTLSAKQIETKRNLKTKSSFELLQMLDLDPVLDSKRWQDSRFGGKKGDELRTLEMCWVVNSLAESVVKGTAELSLDFLAELPKNSLPNGSWNKKRDIEMIRAFYSEGSDKWAEKMISTYAVEKPGEDLRANHLRKRITAVSANAKGAVRKHHRLISLPPQPEVVLIPPEFINKVTAKGFRRFVVTFPIKFPQNESSWELENSCKTAMKTEPLPFSGFVDWKYLQKLESAKLHKLFLKLREEMNALLGGGKKSEISKGFDSAQKIDLSKMPSFDLTVTTAKKIQSRLKLFSDVFRLLSLPDLRSKLSRLKEVRLPTTLWKVPESDLQLIEGILKYGFGNWAAMAEDRSLDFLFYSKTDPLPKDSKVVSRLDYIMRQVLSIKAVVSVPKKSAVIDMTFKKTKLPMVLSRDFRVEKLGRIVYQQKRWSTSRYIFPRGFRSVRKIGEIEFQNEVVDFSDLSPGEKKSFEAEMGTDWAEKEKKGGEKEHSTPIFKTAVVESGGAKKKETNIILANSLIAMTEKLKKLFEAKKLGKIMLASRLYGLREKTVICAIERLENASLCAKYELQDLKAFQCVLSKEGREYQSRNGVYQKSATGSNKGSNKAKGRKQLNIFSFADIPPPPPNIPIILD